MPKKSEYQKRLDLINKIPNLEQREAALSDLALELGATQDMIDTATGKRGQAERQDLLYNLGYRAPGLHPTQFPGGAINKE